MSFMPPLPLTFSPRARIIRTIGDQLISGPEAAVIELVKNAHDADASYVRVTFTPPLERGLGKITVSDDGHGMTLNDIREKWMEPATTDKIERKRSPGGRPLLGSKGIGRFATAKLGDNLELTTTAISPITNAAETTRIPLIDWGRFEAVKYLSEVEFPVEVLEPEVKTGTSLTITKLRNKWTEDGLTRLHHELRRMISPLSGSNDPQFRIYLDLGACTPTTCGFDGSKIVNGPLPSEQVLADPFRVQPFPILKACDYEVSGSFDDYGRFEGTLTIHRGGLPQEPVQLSVPLDVAEEDSCGLVLVHLYIFDRDEQALTAMAARAGYGSTTVKEARSLLDSVAGIAIYRDRFRIRPYGDNDNDWLTLDRRRVQNPTLGIGHNQISGILVIDTEARSGLHERSSREGLEDNGSLRRLKHLMTDLLTKKIEPRRYDFRERAGLGRQKRDKFSDAQAVAQLAPLERLAARLSEPQRTEGLAAVKTASSKLTEYLDALGSDLALLQSKVTLGLIIGEVLHEGRNPVYFIQTEMGRFERWWPTICEDNVESREHRHDVPRIFRGLRNSAERLRSLFSSLEPLSSARRGKGARYNPMQVIVDTLHIFESRAREVGVRLIPKADLDIPDLLGYKEDLATALTNIIDNAFFWLTAGKVPGREVRVTASVINESVVLDVADNGPGVPAEFRERIFDVGFSTKPNGTGLGLAIAREAIGRSGGTIELLDREAGTEFRIILPLVRG
jgi:signal transduction histidine kinase